MKNKVAATSGIIMFIIGVMLIIGFVYWIAPPSINPQEPNIRKTQKQNSPAFSIADMQKQLGPEWKLLEFNEQKWYGPYKTRGGSGWKVYEGEVWAKVGSEDAFLDKPRQKNSIGFGNFMFFPKSKRVIIFFKY